MQEPNYIIESSINHALGKDVKKILSFYNNTETIDFQESSEYEADYLSGVPILKNRNEFSFPLHEKKKMDEFCAFAVDCIGSMNIDKYSKERMGVFLGSGLGGLNTAEKEMKVMVENNSRRVSPFLSIAMFYSSSISQISIFYSITGPAYLFSEGILSGTSSILHTLDCIKRGDIQTGLCGASDMPFSPVCFKAYKDAEILNLCPFFTDGAALFLIGNKSHINSNKSTELAAINSGYFSPDKLEDSLKQALDKSLLEANLGSNEIDLIILSGNNYKNHCEKELMFFNKNLSGTKCLNLNKILGNSISANPVQKIFIANEILKNNSIYQEYIDKNHTVEINTIIISSIDITGNCFITILKK
jgi:hypothetical protein